MIRIVFFFYIIFPVLSFSQTIYDPKVSFAVETYAFLKGQNAALEKVSEEFPRLKPVVGAAEKNLYTEFGRAEKNLKQFLSEELNDTQFDSLHNHIDSLSNHQLSNPIQKEEYAHEFLLMVKERSNENINNESLSKGILSFKYHDKPHQEITDGHVVFFSTENHPKAENAFLKIPIPKSWLAQEASMPETIQQFTSYHGNGNEKILIVAYDLPADLKDFKLSEKSIPALLSPQTKLIRTEYVTIDGIPSVMIEAEESIEYNKKKMKIRMLQFMFVQHTKLYCLQGSIGPAEANEDLRLQIKKYEPLFRLIASGTELNN
ncbi:hypothetical protein [Flavobacterium limi]|uniref:DUF1795 domain-containing protein n=1 Tax=Flavobacterium limi TaxID=2045105 RepID=A0ABQ1UM21_9FLAO|nr:hypothetical protein [Flavobacterium limi]GGF22327.1 hypothetical protein GCM10011518_34410 [Flavobacterium limi]